MKRIFLFLFLTIIGLFVGKAQTTTATQAVEVVDNEPFKPLQKALLWRISGNGLLTSSYLYGTIHLIAKESFFMDDETKEAIKKSQEVIFEIDMEKEMTPVALLTLMPQMLMKDKTLKDLLNEEDYKLVSEKLAASGFPSFLVEKLKPMFISMMLENPQASGDEEGETNMVSYEMEIMDMAKEQQKPMSGLETAMYQMSMFDSIPLEQQATMLVEGIKDTTGTDGIDNMAEIYGSRDINKMVDMMEDMTGTDFKEFLLVGRNRNWIPVMEGKMKQGSMFFAVGAGHLGASFGVINLLRRAGYQVEPIK